MLDRDNNNNNNNNDNNNNNNNIIIKRLRILKRMFKQTLYKTDKIFV